ncbi:glycerol-3-phosphate dehydrogenase/oxidase [Capillimicrobium parvum]|uniref:Glycerol-3-phosphate dehydrogenase n=1 Tax=Capillimicrobium parvum TaxID=2884022 RepID=A0A9E7C1F4_9ACTN|nr:glycerol-3-phosphate dehydrogenase/oxidase [Capillimicrobium parvum]UGS36629.1 Glycerol-3-phosphate dehydrogenase 1 [Capillimicrobium parvum]
MSHRLEAGSALTADRRTRELAGLAEGRVVDVLIVGGGITGAGVALDAASRGLSVALVERGDLAQGTSRWSSKLAHGGLRYLAGGHPAIAWESAQERAVLLRAAPHLVAPLPMLTPLTPGLPGPVAAGTMSVLRAGDTMRRLAGTPRRRLPNARRIDAPEALRLVPELAATGLRGALMSWDGQLTDDAALVVAVARTAASHSARILTRVAARSLDGDGAVVHDEMTGDELGIAARHVVNATGVWAGELTGGVHLRPSRGSHLIVDAARLGHPRAAFGVPLEGSRSRFVFALPRPDATVLVGLTDVPVLDPVGIADPQVTEEEERGLLRSVSSALELPLEPGDVIGRFAGLRPLVEGDDDATADLSRRHVLVEDPDTRVLTVVGGKLTTYRRMAQDAVDAIVARPGVDAGPCRTTRLALVGALAPDTSLPGVPTRLVRRYGTEAADVIALGHDRPELLQPLAEGVEVTRAELLFAVRHELALTVDDLLDRRTRLGLVPARRAAALHAAREMMEIGREAVSA